MTACRTRLLAVLLSAVALGAGGCNVDSFFNPSVSGYWNPTPTTIPIIERIDVIEEDEDYWGQTTGVTPEDLYPNDLTYRTVPGDFVTVSIYELFQPNVWSNTTRRIDQGGFLRLPELGDVPAAGLTTEEIQAQIADILRQSYLEHPQVDVVVEEGSAFNYTVYGSIAGPGIYTLRIPDLRLLDALAVAGGVPSVIDTVYVIRQIELTEDVKPSFERNGDAADRPRPETPETPSNDEPVDIEKLIENLGDPTDDGNVNPGFFSQDSDPVIDIEDLEPPTVGDQPIVDIDDVRRRGTEQGTWVYLEERGEWIRMPAREALAEGVPSSSGEAPLYVERIIEVPVDRLTRGDSRYNIVIRPGDRIFVEPPPSGFVYIDGQIARPGTFSLPPDGITLSRLVAAAGGLGQLAIPERVDLIRKVGSNREAAMRLNLGAIRKRTEPDILLKPDDHIIIGTNFWAVPLAVIRSGFRATYGFGFLLDRNFGNDVFGAPPTNRQF